MKKIKFLAVMFFWVMFFPSLVCGKTLNLDYSTYLGGSSSNYGRGISLGPDGRIYVTGYIVSFDFPTENPYQAGYGGGDYDAFVSALSSSGSALYYSTYLGGSGYDQGRGISVGMAGVAYVTGRTDSPDFPTEKPYQAVCGGGVDSFVSALSSSGSALYYSTYLGGSNIDIGKGINLGPTGAAYIIGETSSPDFPTGNPYQADFGGARDVFVTGLSSTGSTLVYSTYLGGSGYDQGYGINLGPAGAAYITGSTESLDFPTENPYQAGYGGGVYDVFISTLSSTGSVLTYSTYLGGSGYDQGFEVSLGTNGVAYVAGYTDSSDFPTENPYQADFGGVRDAFVSGISSTGSTLVYSTYLGGSGNDQGHGISLGPAGAVCITGSTESLNFPTKNPYQAGYGGGDYDVFVSALSPSGSVLSYSTYLGGTGDDRGYGISAGAGTTAYVTGYTNSPDFPTANPYQAVRGGGTYDVFVSRLTIVSQLIIDSGDYNGDGTSDISIFRGNSGLWAIRGITRVYFGSLDDIPVPGDYDGDSTTDTGIFRASSGLWAIRGVTRSYFGASSDTAVPGDYNGDGECDMGIFRNNSGLWAIKGITRIYFGGSSDSPAPGYYDGDSTKDIGIFRSSSGLWAIKGISRIYFGSSGDEIVPGDYDGDGTWETGIFRGSSGLWAIRGVTRSYFGSGVDQPVPGNYKGDGRDDIGIYRGSSGLWAISGVSRVYFGGSEDIPVTR